MSSLYGMKSAKKTFEDIKQYFLNPSILVPMDFSKETYLYISTTLYALVAMLCQHDDQYKERVIYYLSKTLFNYETRYTPMEKLCLGIVFATEKLRHYLLYCTTPLRKGSKMAYVIARV